MKEADANALVFRRAEKEDLPTIVRLLADDDFVQGREDSRDPLPIEYYRSFAAIDSNPNDNLVVAELAGAVVGTLQLTFLSCLANRGGWRAQIEGVRIDSTRRRSGFGEQLICWAIDRARERGCRLVQLTSNKRRRDALRFYEKLGFQPTHEGLKLTLDCGDSSAH